MWVGTIPAQCTVYGAHLHTVFAGLFEFEHFPFVQCVYYSDSSICDGVLYVFTRQRRGNSRPSGAEHAEHFRSLPKRNIHLLLEPPPQSFVRSCREVLWRYLVAFFNYYTVIINT